MLGQNNCRCGEWMHTGQPEALEGMEESTLANETMDAVGVPEGVDIPRGEDRKDAPEEDPHWIKKRLGMQQKNHARQLNEMRSQMQEMQARLAQQSQSSE